MMKKLLVTACLFAITGVAHADEYQGWYVGGAIGSLSHKVKDVDFDGSGPLLKIFGGYRFNPWVALEVTSLSSVVEDDRRKWDDFELQTTALSGQIVASIPLQGGVSLFGKFGVASWEIEEKDYFYDEYYTTDGTDLIYGGGVQYDFRFPLRLRAEIEAIDIEGENVNDTDVWGITVGAAFRF